jgi:hypothetical protein
MRLVARHNNGANTYLAGGVLAQDPKDRCIILLLVDSRLRQSGPYFGRLESRRLSGLAA